MKISLLGSLNLSECHGIALKQGDLDGACGPYALTMALLAVGAIDRAKAESIWVAGDKRTTFSREVAKLGTLVSNGTDQNELLKIFKGIQKLVGTQKVKELDCTLILDDEQNCVTGRSLFFKSAEHIYSLDHPVILWLDWKGGGAHWVVVVGYQYREANEYDGSHHVEHLLVMDPSAGMDAASAWNGVISRPQRPGRTPYDYWNKSGKKIDCFIRRGLVLHPPKHQS